MFIITRERFPAESSIYNRGDPLTVNLIHKIPELLFLLFSNVGRPDFLGSAANQVTRNGNWVMYISEANEDNARLLKVFSGAKLTDFKE